jgi:antitoxin MazE
MRAVVKKWGNSASVRIPATVLKAANLCLDEPVEVDFGTPVGNEAW